jgi:MarR family transcriptional regulator, organic hydroperoxide resistance regulator
MQSKEKLISRGIELFKMMGQNRMHYQFEPWRELDVPLAQLKSLFLIHIKGSVNVRDLALDLGVTPGNVTSIVDRLVGQELVKRSEGLEDRRIVLLQLTEKGRETINKIHETGENHIRRFLERMSAEDLAALLQGITAFLAATKQDWEESEKNKGEISGHADISSLKAHIHHHHLINLP